MESPKDEDKASKAPYMCIMTKITIDRFSGDPITEEELEKEAQYLVKEWSGQAMTESSIITYESYHVKQYYLIDENDNIIKEEG